MNTLAQRFILTWVTDHDGPRQTAAALARTIDPTVLIQREKHPSRTYIDFSDGSRVYTRGQGGAFRIGSVK